MSKFGYVLDGETLNLVDLHIHSAASIDGTLTIDEIISFAKEHNVKCISITDHNTFAEVRKLWDRTGNDLSTPVIDVDGIKVISGVEVTCTVGRYKNLNGHPTKLHILVYGADMSKESPLSQLLELKSQNDINCDMGLLKDLILYEHITGITDDDIKAFIKKKRESIVGYNSISKTDVWEFLEEHNISIAPSYKALEEILSKLPRYERFNIEAEDLIKIAHASGGLVCLAHPALNLDRTNKRKEVVDFLLDNEIDGFEAYYRESNEHTERLIKSVVKSRSKQREIVYSGGSDTHIILGDNRLGIVNNKPLTEDMVEPLLIEVNRLKKSREKGKLTYREYRKVNFGEIASLLSYYQDCDRHIMSNTGGSHKGEKPKKKGKTGKIYTTKQQPEKPVHPNKSKNQNENNNQSKKNKNKKGKHKVNKHKKGKYIKHDFSDVIYDDDIEAVNYYNEFEKKHKSKDYYFNGDN